MKIIWAEYWFSGLLSMANLSRMAEADSHFIGLECLLSNAVDKLFPFLDAKLAPKFHYSSLDDAISYGSILIHSFWWASPHSFLSLSLSPFSRMEKKLNPIWWTNISTNSICILIFIPFSEAFCKIEQITSQISIFKTTTKSLVYYLSIWKSIGVVENSAHCEWHIV